jgi:phage/plasmid-associated DNA primase
MMNRRSRGIAAMIELAKSEEAVSLAPHALDADPWLLGVENGCINLKTGAFTPTAALHANYAAWSRINAGFEPMSVKSFGRELAMRPGLAAEKNRKVRCIKGLRIKNGVERLPEIMSLQ